MITSYETAVSIAKDRHNRQRKGLGIVSFTSKKQTRYKIYPENLASRNACRDCKLGERPRIEAYISKWGDYNKL